MDKKTKYIEWLMLCERLHRLFLEVIKDILDKEGMKSINSIQALILYNIGDKQITVGEISNRGYYLGSNVSYNLKKMVENGYISQTPDKNDRRSFYISLSPAGKKLYKLLEKAIEAQEKNLLGKTFKKNELDSLFAGSRKIESFLSHLLLHNRFS